MKSDQELRKVYKISIKEDNIIYLSFIKEDRDPEQNVRIAELLLNDIFAILTKDVTRIYKAIIDLSPLGKGGYTTSKARKKYIQISTHKQISKIAIIGGSVFIRTTVGFIIKAAGKGDQMKWFANKAQAFSWIEEN